MSTSLLSSDTSNSNNSNSTIAEHLKWRKPRNHNHSININHHHNSRTPNSDPQMPSIIQSTGCKSTISSLLLSTFTNNNNNHENTITNNNNPRNNNNNNNNNNNGIKKSFKNSSLRGFGCTTQPEVAVPAAVIRSSADWNEQEKKKNNKKINNNKNGYKKKKKIQQLQGVLMEDSSSSSTVVGVQDFWCADSSAADSVDCVRPLSSRNKIDLDKLHQRERALYANRQRVNAEQFAALDLDSAFELPPFGPDVFEARYYHHLRNRSPDGLAEILMFQNGLLTSRRAGGLDRYRDLRLDVDNMTYEELLELGERIGHVSTGLGEDQIGRCLRKTKLSVLTELPSQSHISNDLEGKCSICQEEYDAEEELGKLECGHAYHLSCIEQWLVRKNACPVCKAEASSI